MQRSESAQGNQMSRGSESGGLARRRDPFGLSSREFFSANPFSLMRRMTEEMDRMFDEFGFGGGRAQGGSGTWMPAVEVSERNGNYVVCAELPGLKPDEVKVEVTEDALILEGERKFEHEEDQGGVRRSERRYGHFYRAIPLPEGVNPEQIRARFENGVLEVTVPQPQQQSNRRQIPVEGVGSSTGGSQQASGSQPSSGSQQGGNSPQGGGSQQNAA